mgnify:CR=1 FL=1
MKQIISLTDPKKEIIPNKKLLKPIKILVNIGLFLTALSLPLLDWRFYISGLDKHPLQKEYKILSFENFLIDYKDIIGKDYTVEKVGIREYLIKK